MSDETTIFSVFFFLEKDPLGKESLPQGKAINFLLYLVPNFDTNYCESLSTMRVLFLFIYPH